MSEISPSVHRQHIALHLAHRWFAFFEAAGGNLETHLTMFHPSVRLSGHGGQHLFARDHATLATWFAGIPDRPSSHHIIHSSYKDTGTGTGSLSMLVAFQAQSGRELQGAIINYETNIEFLPGCPRFLALDKTPMLPNSKTEYETSWSANRVLALAYGALGNLTKSDGALHTALGRDAIRLFAHAAAPEGSSAYDAIVTAIGADGNAIRTSRLSVQDDVRAATPSVIHIEEVALIQMGSPQP